MFKSVRPTSMAAHTRSALKELLNELRADLCVFFMPR